MSNREDHLAYGRYYEDTSRGEGDSTRGLVGDTFKKFKDVYKSHQSQSHPSQPYAHNQENYGSQTQSQSHSTAAYHDPQSQYHGRPPAKQDKLSGMFGKLQGAVADIGSDVAQRLGTALDPQAYAEYGHGNKPTAENNRFGSFAPDRNANDVKWYVDGCSYFYAVSKALESARDTIWILDWWLSPELYLRRPPAQNEQYRLDRMLHAAAQRGVRVNIIVYKEVTQALTLSSHHTKHSLENLHPNIAVFRHPDHLPDRQELTTSITQSLHNMSLDASSLAKMSGDAIKGLYGMNDDVILYWAHHEKLCLIDGRIAFMGGLDLCFGRWDTHQHAISDVHPTDLSAIVFPGQDYNNARISDFQDVAQWEQNQLDRKSASRMGWSDVSVSLHGVLVEDLRRHFVERWNFIYDSKYQSRNDSRYSRLVLYGRPSSSGRPTSSGRPSSSTGQQYTSQQAGSQQPVSSPQPGAYQQPVSSPQPGAYQKPSSPQPGYAAYQPPQSSLTSQQYNPQAGSYQQSVSSQPGYQKPSSPQPGGYAAYQPPQTSGSPVPQPYQQPNPGYSSQSSSTVPQQYTYTGDSFPPPPPGPPPSQSPVPTQNQPQAPGQGPHYQPSNQTGQYGQSQSQAPYFPPPPAHPSQQGSHSQTRGIEDYHEGSYYEGSRGLGFEKAEKFVPKRFREDFDKYGTSIRGQLAGQIHQYQDRLTTFGGPHTNAQPRGNMGCQIVRSCSKWSNGTRTEHSIADAYAAVIRHSEHFVYIENQFFITATGDSQKPVKNKIGAAIVERILRAARAGQKYKIIVVIPSVPCFAGDLYDESTLGTRAIMEFQYNSINRGGHSIMEMIAKEGYNPMDYIRFYNLRNYDRINISGPLVEAEHRSGVNYEEARKEYDVTTAGQGGYGPGAPRTAFDTTAPYQQYQKAAQQVSGSKTGSGRWDSVSECYMLQGEDIRNVPWDGPAEAEIDAFVTEELYVHSKVMIADDRVVICGSANLNDRSQLGDHDSEIAIIVEDHTPVHSRMNGQPWMASRFAASLRRQLFQKHLGLLPPQNYQRHDANSEPVGIPNQYDFEAPESQVVADPLADTMHSLWNSRARTNTDVFRKVFHAVPDDTVRNWATYKEFYGYYFHNADKQAYGKAQDEPRARYEYGHVVRDDFAPGPEGVKQVKDLLSQVKGTLVEMPLMFLIEEDVAKEGLTLNDLTEPIYT